MQILAWTSLDCQTDPGSFNYDPTRLQIWNVRVSTHSLESLPPPPPASRRPTPFQYTTVTSNYLLPQPTPPHGSCRHPDLQRSTNVPPPPPETTQGSQSAPQVSRLNKVGQNLESGGATGVQTWVDLESTLQIYTEAQEASWI